jgi:hypothetical protein
VRGSTNGTWERRTITDWDSASDTATVDAWTETPTGTITYVVFATAAAPASLTTGIAAAVWDLPTSGHTTADTFGQQVATDIDAILVDTGTSGVLVSSGTGTGQISVTSGVVSSNVTQFGGSAGSFTSGEPTVRISDGTGTGQLDTASGTVIVGSIAAGAISSTALASSAVDEIWTTTLTESYATDGSAATPAQLLHMLWSVFSQFDISSTTITSRKLDGTTSAMTFTMNDATSPTSRTRAT